VGVIGGHSLWGIKAPVVGKALLQEIVMGISKIEYLGRASTFEQKKG
jgi:hypothetical protein